ncbi:MAG TPA: cation diffusion facilitator family transporter [Xanthobacteraceae bacterium]|nr:cation diffusion facilitator family transporter [Xanthobacteraceae bacterium]
MATEKEKVALTSMAASAALTLAKAAVGLASGSLAILSEAAHSLIDFVATVMTYFAVRIGDKPADEEHHYGHGKIESISALAETALLFALSIYVVWEAGKRLLGADGHLIEASVTAFVVMAASVVIDFTRARALNRVATKTSSEALEADALHFSSDMWSSLAVIVGLGGVALGYPWMDAAAALVVASFICIAGWRLGTRTINTLTDTAPAGVAERIRKVVDRITGVVALDRVRVRQVGPTLFVELGVGASRSLPLDRVAALKTEIERRVRSEIGAAEINVTVDPRALDSETITERIMVIARNKALAVHHPTVQDVGGRLSVSLDLEVDGSLPLSAAHEIASELEAAIEQELGPDVEVETHIEPLQVDSLAGTDASAERVTAMTTALREIAAQVGLVEDIHEVRVRDTAEGEIVNFHCYTNAAASVHDVHDKVDELERGLRRRFPAIKRVIGHAEPRMS